MPPQKRSENSGNGWNEWSRHVLKELEEHNDRLEAVRCEMTEIRIEVAKLKVKAGIWGLVGGAIPVIGVLLFWLLKGIG